MKLNIGHVGLGFNVFKVKVTSLRVFICQKPVCADIDSFHQLQHMTMEREDGRPN